MFKHLRPIIALMLCLTMILTACTAHAAAKLKMTVPGAEVIGGSEFSITVNSTEPGFLTLKLTQGGSYVATLAENREIHTKDNEITLTAVNDSGDDIMPGTYTVTAVMVDQFGVSSAEVSKDMKFKEPQKEETADDNSGSSSSADTSSGKSSGKATAKATPAPKPIEVVVYETGEAVIGEEGYEIGVGVSDADKTAKGYWALTSESTDDQIWAAMQENMIACTVGENENAYIYDSVKDGRKRLGTISGTSQGLNVVAEVGSWSLVEAFRVEDGAFVRGYIRTNKLRTVEPNPTYGLLIDKAEQKLVVFKDGERIGSTPVSTGLPTVKYLHRETPAGEFITVTRRGTIEYYGNGFSKYTVRVNGSYHLSEIPTTKKGGSDYSMLEGSLGTKATRGNIVIANEASTDGGINAEWIWNLTKDNKRIKVLILDDKNRDSVPVGSK